ncbi:MAG: tetratricopeptide repeat protein [Spirochaetaceae bacterium]|jgi:tetratricopeptide (TPR) repeat protein|nr:tetratricopeptide repeat protein [Spirochaetaceae bacterium]
MKSARQTVLLSFLVMVFSLACISCASARLVTSAEEYYTLGMAYFELGKYEEAEQWLGRARRVDKTKIASEYNLGRIAFERGRYGEALKYFEQILAKDAENLLALRAAAYTKIKLSDIEGAEDYYDRVLRLVPESYDDGYNYALILFAMDKADKAEEVLLKYDLIIDSNSDAVLLLARVQAKLEKVEAVDNYDRYLQVKTDNKVRFEYAEALEKNEFYARAQEEYNAILEGLPRGEISGEAGSLTRPIVLFAVARLLLIAESDSDSGITALSLAVEEGFNDIPALEALLEESKITDAQKEEIRRIITNLESAGNAGTEEAGEAENEESGETEDSENVEIPKIDLDDNSQGVP